VVLQLSEIVERHPALKLVFTEQGVEWVIGAVMGTDLTMESWLIAIVEKGSRLSRKPNGYLHRSIGSINPDALDGWTNVHQRCMRLSNGCCGDRISGRPRRRPFAMGWIPQDSLPPSISEVDPAIRPASEEASQWAS